MALTLGNLTVTTLAKLDVVSGASGAINKAKNLPMVATKNAVDSATKKLNASSILNKANVKLPTNCLQNKSTGKGSSGNLNVGGLLKINCSPIISKDDIKTAINIDGEFSYLDKTNKKKISTIVDGAYNKLNSTTLPAISRSMLLKGTNIDCGFDLGLNLPSFKFPDLSFNLDGSSLLNTIVGGLKGIGGMLSVIGAGIGSVLSGIVGCGLDIVGSTLNVLTTANQITDKFASKAMIGGFIESGNLDLSITKQLGKAVPTLSGVADNAVISAPVSKLNMSETLSDGETNDMLSNITKNNSIYEIRSSKTILTTAIKNTKTSTSISNTLMTPAKKLSVLSMAKKTKMKLVA